LEPALFIWEAKMAKVSEKKLLDQVPSPRQAASRSGTPPMRVVKRPPPGGSFTWDEAKAAVIAVMQENKRKKS
jgi:hypothetical protein